MISRERLALGLGVHVATTHLGRRYLAAAARYRQRLVEAAQDKARCRRAWEF